MREYWLADEQLRILGPLGFEVLRDLALSGKLKAISRASVDGRHFFPLAEFPEVLELLATPSPAQKAEHESRQLQRLRAWLVGVRALPVEQLLRVPPGSPQRAYRAAFFAIIRRFSPERLPQDASAELRLAYEDAFLYLCARMTELERSFARVQNKPQPPSRPIVSWMGNTAHVALGLGRGHLQPLLGHPELNFSSECLFIESQEAVPAGCPVDVTLQLEGVATEIHALGRVVRPAKGAQASGIAQGFGVRLTLHDNLRGFIGKWLERVQHTAA